MKVLHYFKTYYPETFGGIEQVIFQLAEGANQYNISSTVLTLSPKSEAYQYSQHSVQTARRNLNIASTGFSLDAVNKFSALSKEADLIHYHYPWPFMDLTHLLVRPKKPTIVTYHSDVIKQNKLLKIYAPLQHWFLNQMDAIVATSPQYAQSSNLLNQFSQKVVTIPLGLSDTFLSHPSSPALLSKWQKIFPKKFLLFIGALRYYKGLDYLLEAARKNSYPIVIIGTGAEEEKLLSYKNQYNLDHVTFLGHQSNEDKNALLSLSHGVILPSHLRSEAFGLALVEGAMYGKPLISCEIGTGSSFINIDADLIAKPADSESLHRVITHLFNLPMNEYKKKSENMRSHFLKHLTQEEMVKSYIDLYRQLI